MRTPHKRHSCADVIAVADVLAADSGRFDPVAVLPDAASEYQSRTLRNLTSTRIECDEIWAFVHAKARNVPEQHVGEFGYGDVWTWMAIDPDTKLVPTFLVATRDEFAAHQFIRDLGSRHRGGSGIGIGEALVRSRKVVVDGVERHGCRVVADLS